MDEDAAAVQRLCDHVGQVIGWSWPDHPGGWPGQIELALIDTIFSARAAYGRPATDDRPATGVHRVVHEWRNLRATSPLDDLRSLRETIKRAGEPVLLGINRARVPGPSPTRPNKWAAVNEVAGRLVSIDVVTSADVDRAVDDAPDDLHAAFTATYGVSDVTFDYFLLLLGHPRVKVDTMVRAFVHEALSPNLDPGSGDPRRVDAKRASRLVRAVAHVRGISPVDLDHAIWRHQRGARRAAR